MIPGMEEAQSQRVTELKRQLSLLEQDEKRLRWLLESKFATPKFKGKTQADLAAVHKDLKRVRAELGGSGA
jgi:hypothetical protein